MCLWVWSWRAEVKTAPLPTVADYDDAFEAERVNEYPVVDMLEDGLGYKLERDRLEQAARTLACPVKANPPNWQHGRVLYALARYRLLHWSGDDRALFVDIGTAKGFSALCLQWAIDDSGSYGQVVSIDVVNPLARVRRNSVAEIDGYGFLTVPEFLKQWPAGEEIGFIGGPSLTWLRSDESRIALAFVDGKHTQEVVQAEAEVISERQKPGDLIVFDDVHIPGIKAAVETLQHYRLVRLSVLPHRAYAIATRLVS